MRKVGDGEVQEGYIGVQEGYIGVQEGYIAVQEGYMEKKSRVIIVVHLRRCHDDARANRENPENFLWNFFDFF